MNKVINQKLYDTETAAAVLSKSYNCSNGNCIEVTLYRKSNGEYFLFYAGLESGGYGFLHEYIDDNHCIHPLNTEELRQWIAENFDGTTYQMFFGNVEE